MLMAGFILVMAAALAFFYLQATCETILRQEFARCYFESVIHDNRLEFEGLRRDLDKAEGRLDAATVFNSLKGDFLALSYLLKNGTNTRRHYTLGEHLVMAYFEVSLLSLRIRHLLRLQVKPGVMRLTAILMYMANVVGQQGTEASLAAAKATH